MARFAEQKEINGQLIDVYTIDSKDVAEHNKKQYYDYHTLYVEANGKTNKEVFDILFQAMKHCPEYDDIKKDYMPNGRYSSTLGSKQIFRCTRDFYWDKQKKIEVEKGTMWVYVYDVRFYNYLIGLNSDGTRRQITDLSPALQAQYQNDQMSRFSAWDTNSSWADEDDAERDLNRKYDDLLHLCPTDKVPGYKYIRLEDCHQWKQFTKPHQIAVMRGYVTEIKDWFVANELLVKGLPADIKQAEVASIFSYFVEYPKMPVVTIRRDNSGNNSGNNFGTTAIVKFDPNGMDASFAQIIMKRFPLIYKDVDYTLSCNYVNKK